MRPRWPDDETVVSWTWTATALVFYLVVINGVVLTLWSWGGEYLLDRRLVGHRPVSSVGLGVLVGVGLAAVAQMPPLAAMWVSLGRSSPPTLPGLVLLTGVAAVAEEMLFRGLLQHLVGPVAATLLFAASHVPSERDLRIWPLTGLLVGAAYAWLHELGGGVLGPAVAHLCWELAGRTRGRSVTR